MNKIKAIVLFILLLLQAQSWGFVQMDIHGELTNLAGLQENKDLQSERETATTAQGEHDFYLQSGASLFTSVYLPYLIQLDAETVLQMAWDNLASDESRVDNRDIRPNFNTLSITFKKIYFDWLSSRIGLQPLFFGRGLIVGEKPEDPGRLLADKRFTRVLNFAAARLDINLNPYLNLFTSVLDRNSRTIATGGHTQAVTLSGVNGGYHFVDRFPWLNLLTEAYLFVLHDSNRDPSDTTVTPGSLLDYQLGPVKLYGELAFQFGRRRTSFAVTDNHNAIASALKISFENRWFDEAPRFLYSGFTFFSGGTTREGPESWTNIAPAIYSCDLFPRFASATLPGDAFDAAGAEPDIPVANPYGPAFYQLSLTRFRFHGFLQNRWAPFVGLSYQFANVGFLKEIFFDFKAFWLYLHHAVEGSMEQEAGYEINSLLHLGLTEFLQLQIMGNAFFPGDFFKEAGRITNSSPLTAPFQEIVTALTVKF